jgi:hypothetical protein
MDEHHERALWAADCAERVLALFEAACPDDRRPREAIEAARLWQAGNLAMSEARARAFAAHAAARQPIAKAAIAAARAAGHAAATAHVMTHAPHAADYARKAKAAAGEDPEVEREWQGDRLAAHLGYFTSRGRSDS